MKKQILTIFATSLLAIALVGCNELKDPRDGKIYRTVKIGKQVWMAENLNYKTEGSYCYQDNPANCKKYGRLYTWNAAYDACPVGWHLPSKAEFESLFRAVGVGAAAGTMLKSKTGWDDDGNGWDALGFSALPGGCRTRGENFEDRGDHAYFWSSTENGSGFAYLMGLYSKRNPDLDGDYYKNNSFSVRCLKD